jgi:hypothetical protein
VNTVRSAGTAAVESEQPAMSAVLRSRSGAQPALGRSIDDLIEIILSCLCAERHDARDLVAIGKFLSRAIKTLKQLDRDFERAMSPTKAVRTPRRRLTSNAGGASRARSAPGDVADRRRDEGGWHKQQPTQSPNKSAVRPPAPPHPKSA